jgi:FtsZ-interacting cell division protein ZipA
MSLSQTVRRGQNSYPSKMMRVAPNVTDPSMQNKASAETLLNEMGVADDVDDVVFSRKTPTREELEHDSTSSSSTTDNTMLIIIFALIVVALVAIIVWMIMKGSDKKDEEEIRRMVRPNQQPMYQHPRNGMPPMQSHPVNGRPRQQRPQQRPPPQEEPEEDVDVEDDSDEEEPKPQPKQKAKKKPADDSFTKDKPHPTILRAGAPPPPDPTEVDTIMKQTAAMLNTDVTSVPVDMHVGVLTNEDQALLDKVREEEDDVADTHLD